MKLKSVICFLLFGLFTGFLNVSLAEAQSSPESIDARPAWVQDSLDLAYYIEANNMVVSEPAKRAFQAKVDAAEGEAKLELMYYHVLEASIYGYDDIMETAKPAYIAEIKRQNSKDHAALMDVMDAFSTFYRGTPSDEDPMERLTQIHQNVTLSTKTRARAYIMQGYLYGFTKRPEITLSLYQEVKDLVRDIPEDNFFQTEMLEFEFFVHMIVGDYEKMLVPARAKLELARELGLLISGDSFSYHLARVIMETGETSAIYEIDAVNQRVANLTSTDINIYHASFLCGRNFLMLDVNARALECLQTAETYASVVPERTNLLNLYLSRAHARAGDAKTARNYFDRVNNQDAVTADPSLHSQFQISRAELLHVEGDHEVAFALQRDFYKDLQVKKSNDLSRVVKQMREYSETQFAIQKDRQRLLESNSDLKDRIIADQRTISIVGILVAIFVSFCLFWQLFLSRKLRLSRREAQVANRAKSEFLANMSHEIRTPMNGVLGMTEALLLSGLTDQQKSYADTVYKSGSSLMVILNDILDFSKIEAGKMELFAEPLNLNAIIDDVAKLMTATASEKPVEVIVRYSPTLPTKFVGDEGRIRQILMNLMSNAVKFTEEGYVLIDVKGDVDGGVANLRIEIQDTGIGVSEAHAAKIFEGFTQAEGSTTRRFGGTGLGLTICRQLVEIMGGEIGVESTLGEGANFWIELKLPAREVEAESVLNTGAPRALEGRQVMILDDLVKNLDILTEYVRSEGGVPTVASNPVTALKVMRDAQASGRSFDLALIDYKMPKANGAAVAKLIHNDTTVGSVPTVLMSTDDLSAYKPRLVKIGVIDICAKPVKLVTLKQIFADLFSNQTSAHQSENQDTTTPPLELCAVSKTEPARPQAPRYNPNRVSVLVVDDDATNRFVLRNFLDADKYDVEEANDGSQAVQMACVKSYDIIFMDISMPILDGEKATKLIRDSDGGLNRNTPIVACTAHAIAGDRERFLAMGMNGYLSKPVPQAKVIAMVTDLIMLEKASRVA